MAAALRSGWRLQQVVLVPRISVSCIRAESGGKSSSHTGISKTRVSFPVKVSHFQQPVTGENRNGPEPLRPVKFPALDIVGSGGRSEREMQLGQEVSHFSARSMDGRSQKDDSSSSSSSDSSSDSESEEEDHGQVADLQRHKAESAAGNVHAGSPPAAQKSSSHTNRGKESAKKQERKEGERMTGENAEDLQDDAPVVTTEEQKLHTAPKKMTLTGADKMETSDDRVPTEGASSTAAADPEEIEILSTTTSEQHPAGAEETFPAESRETQIPSITSEELIEGALETLAPDSRETQIPSITSEDLIEGALETLAPDSRETQIPSTTKSEELPTRAEESFTAELRETQISCTPPCEELPAEEVAELQESSSPPEPHAAPQEPFDNTKYQNLQHFTYTPFTFVDVDVELAKHRLPQPSSGRPSPRH